MLSLVCEAGKSVTHENEECEEKTEIKRRSRQLSQTTSIKVTNGIKQSTSKVHLIL